MIKKNVKKLQLNRETLQLLDLRAVLGGDYTGAMSVETKCKTCQDGTNAGTAKCEIELV